MLKFYTAGESHGQALLAFLSGLPAGLSVDLEFINHELCRRGLFLFFAARRARNPAVGDVVRD